MTLLALKPKDIWFGSPKDMLPKDISFFGLNDEVKK